MTGPKCAKNFVHWTYDTYALGHSLGKALTEEGGKTWFFITADYAFGKDLEGNCAAAVEAAGGKVLGSARHPLNTSDFSSFLLQAQASGADVVAFANAGGDPNTSLKQAAEFGLGDKQRLAGLFSTSPTFPPSGSRRSEREDLHRLLLGLQRRHARLRRALPGRHPSKAMPNDMHAGMYAATEHLLKAMAQTEERRDGQARRRDEGDPDRRSAVRQGLDPRRRSNLHPMYLLATKTVAESKGDWDYFKLVSTIEPEDAWRPLEKGGCPFVKV